MKIGRRLLTLLTIAVLSSVATVPTSAQDTSILVASTTSTQDSGLFGHLLPLFKAATGIEVKVVALGTGQALDVGRKRRSSWPRASASRAIP